MKANRIKGWHFAAADRRLGYDDGRLIRKGGTLSIKGSPVLCGHGLHYSRRIVDALGNAAGPIVCRVEGWGETIDGGHKLCSLHRKTLWLVDAEELLHEFGCMCAEDDLRQAGVTDMRSWDAIKIKRRWMRGEASDEELSAARYAVYPAAYYATDPTAIYAGDSAGWSAWYHRTHNKFNGRLTSMVIAEHRRQVQ